VCEGKHDERYLNRNKSNIIVPVQDSLWMKPFAEFAPRMRVMRYASERRLQTPNIAAHYKKELRVMLQVCIACSTLRILRQMLHCNLS
jgi:hypothetical protein